MRALTKCAIISLAICWCLPVLWILLCSFSLHLLGGILNPADLTLTTAHFGELLDAGLGSAVFNSVWIAFGAAMLGTFIALLIAFGLLCRPEPMLNLLMTVLSGRAVPPIAFLLPQYLFFRTIGIDTSRWALLLVDSFAAASLCLVFVSPFVLRLHNAFFDQVRADGASSFIYFYKILLPQLYKPVLFSLFAGFMLSWSDFLFAGVFVVSANDRTLPVLISSFLTSYGTSWGPMYAAVSVSFGGAITLIVIFVFWRAVFSSRRSLV
jgi:multiple sugar transport system permease protein